MSVTHYRLKREPCQTDEIKGPHTQLSITGFSESRRSPWSASALPYKYSRSSSSPPLLFWRACYLPAATSVTLTDMT